MTAQPTVSRRGLVLVALAVAVLAVAGGGLWYLFLRPAGPAPVTLTGTVGGSASPAANASPAVNGSPGTSAAAGIEGTWTVDPSIGSFEDFSGSFVGYRVRETLASLGATEAVGRTPEVEGSLTVEGTTITAAEITATLTGLRSDDDRRDGQLSRQALETSRFPTATFTLASPIELGDVPAEGATLEVTASGDLTLHGVTRAVEISLQARLQGGVVSIAGSLPIVFADYDMEKPQSMVVLSVEDDGVMELQLHLTRA